MSESGSTKRSLNDHPVLVLVVATFTVLSGIAAIVGFFAGSPFERNQGSEQPPSSQRFSATDNAPARGAGDSISAVVPASSAPVSPNTTLDLARALLTVNDMPAGSAVTGDSAGDSLSILEACNAVDAVGPAERRYTELSSTRVELMHSISRFAGDDARSFMSAVQRDIECINGRSTVTASGEAANFRQFGVSNLGMADQAIGARFNVFTNGQHTHVMDFTLIRRGSVVSYFVLYKATPGGMDPDPSLTERLARTADQRLTVLSGGR